MLWWVSCGRKRPRCRQGLRYTQAVRPWGAAPLGEHSGTPSQGAVAGWQKGGSQMCLTRGHLLVLQAPKDADAQSKGLVSSWSVWFYEGLGGLSELLSLSINHLSEMPLLCLDLNDGNWKPSPQACFPSPNFPTDVPLGLWEAQDVLGLTKTPKISRLCGLEQRTVHISGCPSCIPGVNQVEAKWFLVQFQQTLQAEKPSGCPQPHSQQAHRGVSKSHLRPSCYRKAPARPARPAHETQRDRVTASSIQRYRSGAGSCRSHGQNLPSARKVK